MDGKVFNSSVLIDENGQILARHRKFNELNFALDVYTQGSEPPVAVDTRFGKVGIPICADSFHPDSFRCLAESGAVFALSPCAWAVPRTFDPAETTYGDEWRGAYSVATRARIGVVGVSGVGMVEGGPWHGHPVIGSSISIARDGTETVGKHGLADTYLIEL